MGEMVSYTADRGAGKGYLALPAEGAGPAILLLSEQAGLVGHIVSVADRFVEEGFVVLAPDLDRDIVGKQPGEQDLAGVAGEFRAAADHLSGLPAVRGAGIAAVGFGHGGSLALAAAGGTGRLRLVVAFYPEPAALAAGAGDLTGTAVVIHCAEDEPSTSPGMRELHDRIVAAGGTCTCFDYPGTRFAFFNDDRPEVFDADAAAGAWARTLDALRTGLG